MILVDTNDKNIFILIMRYYLDESLRQIATSVKIPFFGNKKLQPLLLILPKSQQQ